MADENVKKLVFSIMKFLNKQKSSNQGEVLEQIEVAQQVSSFLVATNGGRKLLICHVNLSIICKCKTSVHHYDGQLTHA